MKLLIWLLAFPLTCAIEGYLHARRRKISGILTPDGTALAVAAIADLVIYLWVAHYFAVNP